MTGEKVRKDKHGGEGKKGEWRGREERTGEKVGTQPSTPSLTTLIKLHFFPDKQCFTFGYYHKHITYRRII